MGKSLEVLVGCDPEIFVSPKGKKNLVTAHGLIPGNKYDPHKITNGMVQVDGCALEFGITPAKTAYQWFDRIQSVMLELEAMVPDHKLHIQPVAEFESKYWERDVPETAKMLGCEPDFNAWTGEVNSPPDVDKFPNMRTAAGHIHIGWCKNKRPDDKNHVEDCKLVVKQLDYYVGIFSLLWDTDARRRNLYGKAGAFRPKSYGCEYRVPSNMWLSKIGLIDWVYYSTRKAVQDLSSGVSAEKMFGDIGREIIDENRTDWKTNKLIAYQKYHNQYSPEYYLKHQDLRGPIWNNRD